MDSWKDFGMWFVALVTAGLVVGLVQRYVPQFNPNTEVQVKTVS
jgi:hypothetical protein